MAEPIASTARSLESRPQPGRESRHSAGHCRKALAAPRRWAHFQTSGSTSTTTARSQIAGARLGSMRETAVARQEKVPGRPHPERLKQRHSAL